MFTLTWVVTRMSGYNPASSLVCVPSADRGAERRHRKFCLVLMNLSGPGMTTENLHSLCLLWFHLCLCAVVISKLWLNWNERLTGVLEEDESYWGGKIRGREIGCRALKNSTQTSSADNKSEPEQLFVLAEVTLKLANLPLTVGAPCILPDTIVFNIPFASPLPRHCFQ